MPDWSEYVRRNLQLKNVLPEQESEAIADVARQLEDAYVDAVNRGCSPTDAETEAKMHISDWQKFSRELAQTTRHRSSSAQRFVREAPSKEKPSMFDSLKQDIRYSLRTFIKKPAFFAVASLTLALGIGANTAIFSIVNAVLLKPLPYKESERLVMVYERRPRQNRERNVVAPADFYDWRAQNGVFEHIAAFLSSNINITESGEPERLSGGSVTSGFFSLFGVEPMYGRTFTSNEEEQGSHRVAILSAGLWKRRFSSDPGVIGKTIALNAEPFTVVGILPPEFRFGAGDPPEIWVPYAPPAAEKANRGLHYLVVYGRLKENVGLGQARAEMDALSKRLESEYPVSNGHYTNVFSLFEESVSNVRQSLVVLLGAVGFVLLIACANVANLLLLRTSARRKEIAIRSAVGASRARAIRQFLTESVVLALVGGTLGSLLALVLVPAFARFVPAETLRLDEATLDLRVFVFTFGVSVLTGLIFGFAPALQVSRFDLNKVLNEAGRAGSGSIASNWLRSALVVAEVAIALLLVTGAGLMIRSLNELRSVPLGYKPEGVLTMQIVLPRAKYGTPGQIQNFFSELLARVRALPGVESVGATMAVPSLGPQSPPFFAIAGRPPQPPGQGLNSGINAATSGYFETLKIPLVKGRLFSNTDNGATLPMVVINETMQRQFWPNEDPIGQDIEFSGRAATIIGIVGDARQDGPDKAARPEMFYAIEQNPLGSLTLVVRSSGNPTALASPIRSEVCRLIRNNLFTQFARWNRFWRIPALQRGSMQFCWEALPSLPSCWLPWGCTESWGSSSFNARTSLAFEWR